MEVSENLEQSENGSADDLRLSPFTKWTWTVLAALLAVAFLRMAWCSRSGSEEFASSLHAIDKATIGRVLDRRSPSEKYPDQQLDFWMAEIDRILAQHPNDAELHAAAALMLDEPCSVYYESDILKIHNAECMFDSRSLLDRIAEARKRFDEVSSVRSTDLIRRATQLDPSNPKWWRLRAVLLWPSSQSSHEPQPRTPEWREILQQARHHDPGNALYDILLASHLGKTALVFDHGGRRIVGDPQAWQETIEVAKRIGTASHLTLGEPAIQGLDRLHALSNHPKATTIESIRCRFTAARVIMDTLEVCHNLNSMTTASETTRGNHSAIEIVDQMIPIAQLIRQRSDTTFKNYSLACTVRLLTAEQLALFDFDAQEAAFGNATVKFNRDRMPNESPIGSALSPSLLSCFGLLLVFAIVSSLICLAARCTRAWLRLKAWPLLVFASALTASMFFLGLGPGGAVSEKTQHWTLTALSFLFIASLVCGLAVRSKYRFSFGIRTLMVLCLLVAIFLQTIFHFGLGWSSIGLPISIHHEGNDLVDGFQVVHSPNQAGPLDHWLPGPTWISRSVLQWILNGGPAWSVVICVLFALPVFVWRKPTRHLLGELTVGIVCLLLLIGNLWAWIEPTNYVASRPQQMSFETYIRSVEEYYAPLEKLLAEELATVQ